MVRNVAQVKLKLLAWHLRTETLCSLVSGSMTMLFFSRTLASLLTEVVILAQIKGGYVQQVGVALDSTAGVSLPATKNV